MGEPGRKPTVSDEEILREFVIRPDPAHHATEFVDELELSRQGVAERFDVLESKGCLGTKKIANRRIWWITEVGRRVYYEEMLSD